MTNNTITEANTSAAEWIPSAKTASLFAAQPITSFPIVNKMLLITLIQATFFANCYLVDKAILPL